MIKLDIGQTVYTFSMNNRVYKKDENGRSSGSPIYSKHFRPFTVVSEDDKVYHLDSYGVINKRSGNLVIGSSRVKVYTEEEKQLDLWKNQHKYKVVSLVGSTTIENLKKIAKILDYNEED